MAVKVLESEKKPYLRYEFKVTNHPTKENVVRIDCIDNYWDKSDYMLSDHNTGEIYSYNDVALKTCMQMINACRIDTYNVVNGMHLKAYFTEPLGRLVKVEGAQLTESLGRPSSDEDVRIHTMAISNQLHMKASRLNKITDHVVDGLLTDVGMDCLKISEMLRNGSIDEALRNISELALDAKTILSTAKQLESVCEGIMANAERLERLYK